MNCVLAFSIDALPFVAAFGLYATGTLVRIDNSLGMRIDRLKFEVGKPRPGPTQPLAQYAGLWQRDAVPNSRDPQKNPHVNQSSFTALRRVK